MPESTDLTGSSADVQLGIVEREATQCELMRLSIQLHLRSLSLANTVRVLENFRVGRARLSVHNWVQKAELQPSGGNSPDHVALDETVIQLTDQRYWLYAAVDPETNEFLHVRLFPTRNTAVAEIFLAEVCEKHDVDDVVFLVDSGPWLHAALRRRGLRFRYERHGDRNAVERPFQEIKRRTYQFDNYFRNAEPETAENWLQRHAYLWNHHT